MGRSGQANEKAVLNHDRHLYVPGNAFKKISPHLYVPKMYSTKCPLISTLLEMHSKNLPSFGDSGNVDRINRRCPESHGSLKKYNPDPEPCHL
jgi:hypothetical protein